MTEEERYDITAALGGGAEALYMPLAQILWEAYEALEAEIERHKPSRYDSYGREAAELRVRELQADLRNIRDAARDRFTDPTSKHGWISAAWIEMACDNALGDK